MRRKLGYKLFEDKKGFPHSLFHGTNGTRKIPIGKWIKADVKRAKEGTDGKYYQSGFHVMIDIEDLHKLIKRFRDMENRVVAKVFFRGVRKKEHSPHDIILADEIFLEENEWLNRVTMQEW